MLSNLYLQLNMRNRQIQYDVYKILNWLCWGGFLPTVRIPHLGYENMHTCWSSQYPGFCHGLASPPSCTWNKNLTRSLLRSEQATKSIRTETSHRPVSGIHLNVTSNATATDLYLGGIRLEPRPGYRSSRLTFFSTISQCRLKFWNSTFK
jgi:hypothetical protein